MKTKKGFTLAEMVAVIAILMVLAVLSLPYVRGYIDDSYNGKAIIHMRELNEARLNFERDYPGTTVVEEGREIEPDEDGNPCPIDSIYTGSLSIDSSVLGSCHYLSVPTALTDRYNFHIGGSCNIAGCESPAVTMEGTANAGKYNRKCACIDSLGRVHKQQ